MAADVGANYPNNTQFNWSPGGETTSSITVFGTGDEHLATHHYENGDGERVDIDPRQAAGAQIVRVTNYDHYIRENDKLKEIKVIRPDAIQSIIGNYFEAIKS